MKFIYTLILCFLFASLTHAQTFPQGELVTEDGDTSQVFLNTNYKFTNSQKIGYRSRLESRKTVEVAVNDFISFSGNDIYLKKIQIGDGLNKQFIIAEVSKMGWYTLFATYDKWGGLTMYYEKNNEGIKEVPKYKLYDFVATNFNICDKHWRMKSDSYTVSYMKTVLSMDLSCVDPVGNELKVYEYKPKLSVSYFVGIQYVSSAVQVQAANYSYTSIFGNSGRGNKVYSDFGMGFQGGVSINLKLRSHLSLRYDITLDRKVANFDDLTLEYIGLQFPILFSVVLDDLGPRKNFNLSAGLIRPVPLAMNLTYEEVDFKFRTERAGLGYTIGISRDIKVYSKRKGSIEIKYENFPMNLVAVNALNNRDLKVWQSSFNFKINLPF